MRGVFVTGTGTGVGKTWVTRGLARALRDRHLDVAAVKPVETGCAPNPEDAIALAAACRRPELAEAPEWYRASSPVAPYAVTMAGEPAVDLRPLIRKLRTLGASSRLLVEGAGGLLVPLTSTQDVSHLARAVRCPILLVARDELGVLSNVLAYAEVAQQRGLEILAVALTPGSGDASTAMNATILSERLQVPISSVPVAEDDDGALARAVEQGGLLDVVIRRLTVQ